MKKLFAYGGIAASVILVAFGIGAIVIGVTGLNTVRDELTAQKITAIDAAELTNGKLHAWSGDHDRRGGEGLRGRHGAPHARGDEGAVRYAEMGRFLTTAGKDTNDEALAAKTPEGRPVENGLRNCG